MCLLGAKYFKITEINMNQKHFLKRVCLLLTLVLALTMTACGGKTETTEPSGTTGGTEATEATDPTETVPATTAHQAENPIAFFSMTLSPDGSDYTSLNVYANEDGSAYVDYTGAERKVGDVDASALHSLTAALEQSGLRELDGRSEMGDGAGYASMYIQFADDTYLTADFTGTAPQEFLDGFGAMEDCFRRITAQLPVYVPEAQVMGQVNPDALAAMQEILNTSGMENLDSFVISDIPMDAFFTPTMGLSSSEGITSGTSCGPMMMTTPYGLVIVTLEDPATAQDVCDDFEANVNWNEWVCVSADSALIACKDNMVLCLRGSGSMFQLTADAVENAGWSYLLTLNNPGV